MHIELLRLTVVVPLDCETTLRYLAGICGEGHSELRLNLLADACELFRGDVRKGLLCAACHDAPRDFVKRVAGRGCPSGLHRLRKVREGWGRRVGLFQSSKWNFAEIFLRPYGWVFIFGPPAIIVISPESVSAVTTGGLHSGHVRDFHGVQREDMPCFRAVELYTPHYSDRFCSALAMHWHNK